MCYLLENRREINCLSNSKHTAHHILSRQTSLNLDLKMVKKNNKHKFLFWFPEKSLIKDKPRTGQEFFTQVLKIKVKKVHLLYIRHITAISVHVGSLLKTDAEFSERSNIAIKTEDK